MQKQLTEAEAWRMIGEAFEAKVEHPELGPDLGSQDLARDGLCTALNRFYFKGRLDHATERSMVNKIYEQVDAHGWGAYLHPLPGEVNAAEARTMLAYLFAEEAAA